MGISVVLCILCAQTVWGYYSYKSRIPNGDRVPHPCKPNELWDGVGHFVEAGGGHRNPFGQDFYDAGKEWTEALCQKDSDGDGKTNGQELGDPDCTWRPGEVPKFTSGLSHPGVCEPLDSVVCQQRQYDVGLYRVQQEWMADACKRDEFVCEGLSDPDLKNVTLRFPKTPVPAEETTYICAVFDFPEPDSDVHMIATTPLLDNRHVMHHAVLTGCTGETPGVEVGVPYKCGMSAHLNCSSTLSIWSLGLNGECFHSSTGFRIGAKGFKRFAIQFHWNNPERISTYEDSSGLTLYYTPNLRAHDAAIFSVGSEGFVIPPRRESVTIEGLCSAGCTRKLLTQPMYVTAAWNHMHYLGVSQTVEQYRNGTHLRDIANDIIYSYDSPKTHEYSTPFEVLPGDEIKVRCHYNSMTRTNMTTWGDSTQQEMCYGFLYYYPAEAIPGYKFCHQYRDFLLCDTEAMNGCNPEEYWPHLGTIWGSIYQQCVPGNCTPACKAIFENEKATSPCMAHRDFAHYLVFMALQAIPQGQAITPRFASCFEEVYGKEEDVLPPTEGGEGGEDPTGSAASVRFSFGFAVAAAVLSYSLKLPSRP